jgi:hypothetical protein
MENEYDINIPFERPRHNPTQEFNTLHYNLEEVVCNIVYWVKLANVEVAYYFEYGNELSCLIKAGKFLEYLGQYHFLTDCPTLLWSILK